jgi:Rrf2 family nitric oxide-sensitive transcriptional repressor
LVFSQTAEYALRAIVWLAAHREAAHTTRQIARGTKVPADYLSKVLQSLGRAGYVSSQRGLHGGFVLAVEPRELSILDVINVVDPLQRIRECPLGIEMHGANLCLLHQRLDRAIAEVERVFATSTVADVLRDRGPGASSPLCESGTPDAPPKAARHAPAPPPRSRALDRSRGGSRSPRRKPHGSGS